MNKTITTKCELCAKDFNDYKTRGRRFCSRKCADIAHKTDRELRNGGYQAIHKWLKNHYGKACRCEMKECNGTSNTYEWALIKGRKHEHKKENYMELCKSCHMKYDMTEETKKKISKTKLRKKHD